MNLNHNGFFDSKYYTCVPLLSMYRMRIIFKNFELVKAMRTPVVLTSDNVETRSSVAPVTL